MIRRWIIRGGFLLCLLLSLWLASKLWAMGGIHGYGTGLRYDTIPHCLVLGYQQSSFTKDNAPDKLHPRYGSRWCTRWQWAGFSAGRYNFELFVEGMRPVGAFDFHFITLPHWFLTSLSVLALGLVWWTTRAWQRERRAFPIVISTPEVMP